MPAAEPCFHCLLPNPTGTSFSVTIDGKVRAVCCPGCKAVAELIRDTGMSRYYAARDVPDPGVVRPDTDNESEWQAFNTADMLAAFADLDDNTATATLYAGGMYCAACSWLIESSLSAMPGVSDVDVNPLTHRLQVRWKLRGKDGTTLGLGDLLHRLSALGYRPQPLAPGDTRRPEVEEQRSALKRLLVASLGMMQVMMFAAGLYAGALQGIDDDMLHFLRLVSFLVATPVVFYAAAPFFKAAWRGLKTATPGMDLPVAIAIGAAYAASVYATFTRGPAVWFDSVAMFVFFLTLGRYLEMRARHRAIDRSVALSDALPVTATLVIGDQLTIVAAERLRAGDIVLVRAGDAIPADGILLSGETAVDESLLTGESTPVTRGGGDIVAAGSVNVSGDVRLQVSRSGADTTLSAISRMSERARYVRPAFVALADRIATYLVIALLGVAAATAAYWYAIDSSRAFEITLSVLVVTCPCALALATPASFAAAGSRMSQLGLLLTNGDSLESLSQATHIVFDKTGTLTTGRPTITRVIVADDNETDSRCRSIAAALEQVALHPIAEAFKTNAPLPSADGARNHPGQGVSGIIAGFEWRLGSAAFALRDVDTTADREQPRRPAVFLGRNGRLVATFEIAHELRVDAKATVRTLQRHGLLVSVLSGDQPAEVQRVSAAMGIADWRAECSPAEKLRAIQSLQPGARVVMVGDGINDAPVLAAADVSIAPGHGALLAQTNADIIMLGDSLQPVATAFRMARATVRTVRQNLVWAGVYNLVALPLAVAGWVPPWAAAIGMSASSLLVVLNALRLNSYR